ncbi:MAG TPA: AAA family ATPase [Puia sp.]|jgi:hypothetical protein|nr:AAA family ATPase [Puia sp.]
MQLQTASRKKARIKLGLQGPSGSGKTFSALLLAYGLTDDWSKIAVIDTENHSADLYAHLGNYFTLTLESPFSPEIYVEAIVTCVKAGIEVVIIDSVSHEWEGAGGILEIHSGMTGNSFTNWSKVTPRHNKFIQEILQSPIHVIATIRSKQDYILNDKNGKQVPEKIGLKGVTKEGLDYELTLVFNLDIKHNAVASKDRTSLFIDKPEFQISTATGKKILEWCNSGKEISIEERINESKSIGELLELFKSASVSDQEYYQSAFSKKRELLQPKNNHSLKPSQNGTHTSRSKQQ